MDIVKKEIARMTFPYAVRVYDSVSGKRVACATEAEGPGICFSAEDGSDIKTLWTGPGGTMTIWELDDQENFLATHAFFKGFQSQNARVVKVQNNGDGTWRYDTFLNMPYLHRFCIVEVGDERWFLGGTLCDSKKNRDDWSKAGRVYVGRVTESPENMKVKEIMGGLHKNHGMFCGERDGKQVVMVTGVEGVYEIIPPDNPSGEWHIEQLLDTEVSDIRVFDLDDDGVDELITIEGFHGDRMFVYKRVDDSWKRVYEYPVAFGHALWCGKIFGVNSILMGYKMANGALVLMQKKPGVEFSMEITVLDELQSVSNLDVYDCGDHFNIYAACSAGSVNMYTLKP